VLTTTHEPLSLENHLSKDGRSGVNLLDFLLNRAAPEEEDIFGQQVLEMSFDEQALAGKHRIVPDEAPGGNHLSMESTGTERIIKCPLCGRNVNLNANHASS
jgi:hypothetical protein